MKRFFTVAILSLYACFSWAQAKNDFLVKLSSEEADYIQSYFLNDLKDSRFKDFDLKNKDVLFVTGSAASTLGSKTNYLNQLHSWKEKNLPVSTWITKLNDQERVKYGYDYVITYWVKFKPNLKRLAKKIKSAH